MGGWSFAWASAVAQTVKNLPAMQRPGFDLGSGRDPGEGNGNLLQCSCLETPMDRGAWWATVHRVTKSPTGLRKSLTGLTAFHCISLFGR